MSLPPAPTESAAPQPARPPRPQPPRPPLLTDGALRQLRRTEGWLDMVSLLIVAATLNTIWVAASTFAHAGESDGQSLALVIGGVQLLFLIPLLSFAFASARALGRMRRGGGEAQLIDFLRTQSGFLGFISALAGVFLVIIVLVFAIAITIPFAKGAP